ncbi:MAG: hypothetical protein LUE20_10895 [Oscillospiraceae bacterium]|nr:hypothetical protein [Oscillospiraceae bacterium]
MRSKKEKKPLGTTDRILIILGGFMGIFTIAMIVTFYIKDAVPDTLITCVMGCSGVEGILTAAITISKNITGSGKDSDKDEQEDYK